MELELKPWKLRTRDAGTVGSYFSGTWTSALRSTPPEVSFMFQSPRVPVFPSHFTGAPPAPPPPSEPVAVVEPPPSPPPPSEEVVVPPPSPVVVVGLPPPAAISEEGAHARAERERPAARATKDCRIEVA